MTCKCRVRTTEILLHNEIRFSRVDDHASKALLISLKLHIFCLSLTLRVKNAICPKQLIKQKIFQSKQTMLFLMLLLLFFNIQ